MCKVFPSSLGPVAMRWFDSLEEGSIHSFEELTRAFGARFVTYSWVPRPLDSLLLMSIRGGETLKNYFDRYWEIYNEIDGDFEDVIVQTFKVGLPTHFDLWKSLTMKLPRVCINWWIKLRNIKGLRITRALARVKLRLSPLTEGIARQASLHLLGRGGSFIIKHPIMSLVLKQWTRCSKSHYIKC